MFKENRTGQDKWYHCMTTCIIANTCASTTIEGSFWAGVAGVAAETADVLIKGWLGQRMTENIQDSAEDMGANLFGLGYGIGHGGPTCEAKCKQLDKRPCGESKP